MHHDGENHVSLFDSSKTSPSESLLFQLKTCYKKCADVGVLQIEYREICRQKGGSHCGLFVIAFATDLAHGTNPEDVCYDQDEMRAHLSMFLREGLLIHIPRLNVPKLACKKMDYHVLTIDC